MEIGSVAFVYDIDGRDDALEESSTGCFALAGRALVKNARRWFVSPSIWQDSTVA
jgi:hypothetical protein